MGGETISVVVDWLVARRAGAKTHCGGGAYRLAEGTGRLQVAVAEDGGAARACGCQEGHRLRGEGDRAPLSHLPETRSHALP